MPSLSILTVIGLLLFVGTWKIFDAAIGELVPNHGDFVLVFIAFLISSFWLISGVFVDYLDRISTVNKKILKLLEAHGTKTEQQSKTTNRMIKHV